MRAHTEYVQSLICVYCTECAVMNRNAMPCLALQCLALPCLATYVYIYILFGAEVVCASCSSCIVSLPRGQDVQRGTFAHRHCVVKDQNTGEDHCS